MTRRGKRRLKSPASPAPDLLRKRSTKRARVKSTTPAAEDKASIGDPQTIAAKNVPAAHMHDKSRKDKEKLVASPGYLSDRFSPIKWDDPESLKGSVNAGQNIVNDDKEKNVCVKYVLRRH